jgi:hypothetical protein
MMQRPAREIHGNLIVRRASSREFINSSENARRFLMDNRFVIRRMLALGLALTVQGGAVCAPFLHAHVDADRDDHHSTAVHAHFSSHAPAHVAHDGVSVEDADRDHAIYLQVFVAVEASVFQPPALPHAVFAPLPVIQRAPRTFVLVTHGHDPPLVHALLSRPPPSVLS